ncbi:MAG: DUF1801 domain-containing protein [Ignavibacteria bacterium]
MHLILKKESTLRKASPEVNSFVEKFPNHIRRMIQKIRSIILSSAPGIHESLKHKIPFYTHKGLLCYINPTNEKVIIGFSKGAEFANDDNLLVGSGKTMRHLIYKSIKEIKTEKLQHLIYEALIINEIHSHQPRKKKKVLTF